MPGPVDQDAAHGLGGGGEEVPAPIPVLGLLPAHQPQVRLVHQRGRLQGLTGLFVGQFLDRELAQLVVDERQELLARVPIALLDGVQDLGNVTHRRHRKGDGLNWTTSPNLWIGLRDLCPAQASPLLTHQVLSTTGRQSMSIPAAWPQVLDFFGTPLKRCESRDEAGNKKNYSTANRSEKIASMCDSYASRATRENRCVANTLRQIVEPAVTAGSRFRC